MIDMLDARPGARGNTRIAGSFRVEEFRVPLMKAEIVRAETAASETGKRGSGPAACAICPAAALATRP